MFGNYLTYPANAVIVMIEDANAKRVGEVARNVHGAFTARRFGAATLSMRDFRTYDEAVAWVLRISARRVRKASRKLVQLPWNEAASDRQAAIVALNDLRNLRDNFEASSGKYRHGWRGRFYVRQVDVHTFNVCAKRSGFKLP